MGRKRNATIPQVDPAEKARREADKRARLDSQVAAARRSALRSAGIDVDARTAPGRREYQVDDLGATKRARTLRYDRLFKNKAEALPERSLACQMFDDLWHAAHTGLLPLPKFDPAVDVSHRDSSPLEGAGLASMKLSAFSRRVGDEGTALLYFRVVLNWTFKALEREGYGDERRLSAQFLAASDAAARFFGLRPESALVERMKAVAA